MQGHRLVAKSGLVANQSLPTRVTRHRSLVGFPLACGMMPQQLVILCTACARALSSHRQRRPAGQICDLHAGLVVHVAEPVLVRDGYISGSA